MQPTTQKDDRSLGDLIKELTYETSLLVRQEVKLAKTEIVEKITKAQHGVISLAIGGLVAYAGLLALLASVIIGLGQVVPYWVSALLVGIIVSVVGLTLIGKGRENLKAENLALHKTKETLREDKQWVQAQMK